MAPKSWSKHSASNCSYWMASNFAPPLSLSRRSYCNHWTPIRDINESHPANQDGDSCCSVRSATRPCQGRGHPLVYKSETVSQLELTFLGKIQLSRISNPYSFINRHAYFQDFLPPSCPFSRGDRNGSHLFRRLVTKHVQRRHQMLLWQHAD